MAKKTYYMAAGVAKRLGLLRQTVYDAIERGTLKPSAFAAGSSDDKLHPLFDERTIERYREQSLGKRSGK